MALKIQINSFGRLKTPGIRDATDYYFKLIRTWAEVEEVELKPILVRDKSDASRRKNQEDEAQILKDSIEGSLAKRGYLVLLDEKGKAMSTREWATFIQDVQDQGYRTLHFAI
ncbi:MAG: 23S rRNA (pseudouridine(1915)-N(3))-methyltransferase RlmH, partial [Bdellovibrionales bacterium]|nr:23S rRNA (pseudouridine(1915)-N(3))-methyltransferase RlmH [Bdellovibrionales bacterium]